MDMQRKFTKEQYETLSDVSDMLMDTLGMYQGEWDEFRLQCAISITMNMYMLDVGKDNIDPIIFKYLAYAQVEIIEWDYSYDKALQIVNNHYGYNPDTGEWDGTYTR